MTNVTIFSAFNNLITYPLLVVYRIINGMRASLALKITRKDENCFSAFQEIQAFAYFCVCLVVPVFLLLANKFVSLWIGPAYQITTLQLILCGAIIADGFIMPAIYSARDAKGLYKESKGFAISQAVVNVVLSVALVIPFGITGVLVGTVAAAYFILQPFNFRLVYSKVFDRKLTIYRDLVIVLLIVIIAFFFAYTVNGAVFTSGLLTWKLLILESLLSIAIVGIITAVGLWSVNSGFRSLLKRYTSLLRSHR